jgi:hypothetical protein
MRKEPANGPLWEDLGNAVSCRHDWRAQAKPAARRRHDVLFNVDRLFAFASALARIVVFACRPWGLSETEIQRENLQ